MLHHFPIVRAMSHALLGTFGRSLIMGSYLVCRRAISLKTERLSHCDTPSQRDERRRFVKGAITAGSRDNEHTCLHERLRAASAPPLSVAAVSSCLSCRSGRDPALGVRTKKTPRATAPRRRWSARR